MPIRCNAFTGADQHEIAGNQLAGGNPSFAAVANDPRLRLRERLQGLQRMLASSFLQNHHAERDNGASANKQAFAKASKHEIKTGRRQ